MSVMARPSHVPAVPSLWYQGQVQTVLSRRGGPLVLVRGEGSRVWDAQGRSYLDARSGLWAALIGYGRAEVVDAVSRQLSALSFAPLTDVASAAAQDLAERLRAVLPGDFTTVVLVPTGSEAVDTALKFARLYHYAGGERRRRIVISREYATHGSTYAGASLSDRDRGLLRGMGPGLSGIRFAPAPYRYRCRFCALSPACTLACAGALEEEITAAGPKRAAAVFAEPVPGPGGVIVPPEEYWPQVRALCDRHGVLLVADEVVTGFGRTGRWFACEHWDLVPDLLILGKGMTGGYQSLAAVALRRHVAERLAGRLVPHGFTYSGHPAACAAVLACLRIIAEEGLVARAGALGARLRDALRRDLAACPVMGEVRGIGLMCAVELVEDRGTRAPLRLGARGVDRLEQDLRDRGVLCFADNPLILAPPLVVNEREVDDLAGAVADAVQAVAVTARRPTLGRRPTE
jgi:adenosylmethionine-8-amino-7-oxononanoate aminotransferase